MQPSDSRPPVGRGSGRPWPVAYPVPRATRRKKGRPGAWAVLFQRAVGSDPAGCASRRAHRVETAIAFRLHNALGTQNERYFVAVNPTAHSLACLRIGVFVTADAARLATGVGGSPFTGRVSHPLDGEQSFMTSPHRHSSFDQPCLVAPCTNACAGKARSRGTRCRDVIFETLFDTLWVSNPIRPRSAASRNRVMRGPGVTQGAKRSQGARRPRD